MPWISLVKGKVGSFSGQALEGVEVVDLREAIACHLILSQFPFKLAANEKSEFRSQKSNPPFIPPRGE